MRNPASLLRKKIETTPGTGGLCNDGSIKRQIRNWSVSLPATTWESVPCSAWERTSETRYLSLAVSSAVITSNLSEDIQDIPALDWSGTSQGTADCVSTCCGDVGVLSM